mmetsp:Transcript_38752/g.97620  ORF Transcript_38752/g.97620 Transcript_38752/m.97620 type:complete len:295 (+) Transcript_38752:238-1122(+)
MYGGESKCIQKTIRAICLESLQLCDTRLDIDGTLLAEGTSRMKLIIENDGTSHAPQTEHVGLIRGKLLLCNHFLANRGHDGEGSGHILLRYRSVLREELGSGLVDDVHHGGGVGKEEGHAVGELVLDGDLTVVLLGETHTVQCTTVVGEVVLDGWVEHLEVIELQDKVEHVGELLAERLAGLQLLLGVLLAESHQKVGEAVLQFQAKVVELLEPFNGGQHASPGLLLALVVRGRDGLTDELFTALVLLQFLQDIRALVQDLCHGAIDLLLFVGLRLSLLKIQEDIDRFTLASAL